MGSKQQVHYQFAEVKIRGFRVEIGDVTRTLLEAEGLNDCYVLPVTRSLPSIRHLFGHISSDILCSETAWPAKAA